MIALFFTVLKPGMKFQHRERFISKSLRFLPFELPFNPVLLPLNQSPNQSINQTRSNTNNRVQ